MQSTSKAKLDEYSLNIFSDNKKKRQTARRYIINHIENFKNGAGLKTKEIAKYPDYDFVAYAINEFMSSDKFVFAINNKKPGEILQKGRESFPGRHSSLAEDSNKPTYLVTMPHLPRKGHSLDAQINLLFAESFGINEKESRDEAKKRLQLFVGINACHTINHCFNKRTKARVNNLLDEPENPNVSFEIFYWAVQWKSSSPPCKKAPQVEVKRLFRLLQDIDKTKASKVFSEIMKNKIVPFQHIREEIKNSPSLTSYFRKFRKNRQDRPCYLAVVDDDAVKLRTSGVGLFSHYDSLIREHPALEAASTGYYMEDPDNAYIKIGSVTNLVARRAIADLRPNGAYLPEPNVIFKFPEGHTISEKVSFLREGENCGGSLESLGMLERLNLMKGDVKQRVIWGNKGAIQTAVSPNVNIPKHLKSCDSQSFRDSKNLNSLRAFSQSAINPLYGFAMNILRTYPKGYNNSRIKKHISAIFTSFDAIEYAKKIPTCWLYAYDPIVDALCRIYEDGDTKTLGECIGDAVESIRTQARIDRSQENCIADLIDEKAKALLGAKTDLLALKKKNKYLFEESDMYVFVQTSINTGGAVFLYLQDMIEKKPYTV